MDSQLFMSCRQAWKQALTVRKRDYALVYGPATTDASGRIAGPVAAMTESESGVQSEKAFHDALG
jgi:hypothetical protein